MEFQTRYNELSALVIVLAIVLLPLLTLGQANLVPNPSFEEPNPCPGVGGNVGWVTHWFIPSQGNNPDYWSECAISGSIVPNVIQGFQYANTGGSFIGIYTFSKDVPQGREAISVELLAGLIAGKKYVFRAYLSLADNMLYSTRTLGYKLTVDELTGPNPIVAYAPTYFNTIQPLNDKENWTLITDTVVADGGERYLTIANFQSDSLSDTTYVGSGNVGWDYSYYYVDDVSLIPLDSLLSTSDNEVLGFNIYPNPTNNRVFLKSKQYLAQVELFDLQGRWVSKMEESQGTWSADIGDLPNGIYVLKAIATDGRWSVQRVVKVP